MNRTSIEWTRGDDGSPGYTWNPLRGTAGKWACVRVSPGCEHCYAEAMNVRFGGPRYQVGADQPRLDERELLAPARLRKPARIFICSMSDLFWDQVDDVDRGRIFGQLSQCAEHTFIVLTKRPAEMRRFIKELGEVLPNVWLGVTAENQQYADERIPILLDTPAARRFVSLEPLLGPIDLTHLTLVPAEPPNGPEVWLNAFTSLIAGPDDYLAGRPGLDWVITGGESGGPAERRLVRPAQSFDEDGPQPVCERCGKGRPHPEHACSACGCPAWVPTDDALTWIRDLRGQCKVAGVPYFHKQWGGPTSKSGGHLLDEREELAWPAALEAERL